MVSIWVFLYFDIESKTSVNTKFHWLFQQGIQPEPFKTNRWSSWVDRRILSQYIPDISNNIFNNVTVNSIANHSWTELGVFLCCYGRRCGIPDLHSIFLFQSFFPRWRIKWSTRIHPTSPSPGIGKASKRFYPIKVQSDFILFCNCILKVYPKFTRMNKQIKMFNVFDLGWPRYTTVNHMV